MGEGVPFEVLTIAIVKNEGDEGRKTRRNEEGIQTEGSFIQIERGCPIFVDIKNSLI